MANFHDLCRLCTKQDDFSKDVLDKCNKYILKLIEDYVQIPVNKSDNLPKKLCLACEEKLISFQLFVLSCHKAQETLDKLLSGAVVVKDEKEESTDDVQQSTLSSQIKVEMTAEEIVDALSESKEGIGIKILFENDMGNDYDGGDVSDEISIAALKEIKNKHITKKTQSLKDLNTLNKFLKLGNFKVKDLIKFECILCDEKTKSWTYLSTHYVNVHQTEPMVICVCGFQITSKAILYKHVREHKAESRKIRNELDSRGANKPEDHNIKDYISFACSECTLKCSSWYSLKAHFDECHEDLQPIVKCRCGIILKSKSVMYKHVNDHLNPVGYSCDKCGKQFKTQEALFKHSMRHIPKSERRYPCSKCDKVFLNKDCQKSHEKSHIPIEERKKFGCDICGLKFTTPSSAASHRRTVHEKIKAFVCDLCGYACGTSGELRQHRAIHSDEKPFQCNTCSKAFKTYSNLKTHMDIHEDTAYECYICRRVLNSRRTLRKHLLVHEDKCRHVCSYCNKAFKRRQTLKVHLSSHTGDKPLSCKWCPERFAYASTLRSHRLRCHPDKVANHYTPTYAEQLNIHDGYHKSEIAANAPASASGNKEVEVIIG